MKIPFYQADAFTDIPFKGNPAAVCLLEKELPDDIMQTIAAENFLPETAFVRPLSDGYALRWFSPKVEIPLCGHATLATAHILWEQGIVPQDQVLTFHTLSGKLTVEKEGEWLHLDFPGFGEERFPEDTRLERAIGVPVIRYTRMHHFLILEIEDAEQIPVLQPDLNILQEYEPVVVTAGTKRGPYDFVSRVFGPSIGIPEDPVTGSAHCCLGPYWGKRSGKEELLAYQASERGGEVKIRLSGDRVRLSGKGVTVIEGGLNVPG